MIQTVQAGELDVVLLAPAGALHQGRNTFTIEFRRAGTTPLVDAGTVRASANMPMPGMVMSGGMQVTPTGLPEGERAPALPQPKSSAVSRQAVAEAVVTDAPSIATADAAHSR